MCDFNVKEGNRICNARPCRDHDPRRDVLRASALFQRLRSSVTCLSGFFQISAIAVADP